MLGAERNTAKPKNYFINQIIEMVGRQNYCAGTAKLLHTILPFNGTEKTMMIHYNDEALFREFVAKGKAYGNGKYDFTFEDGDGVHNWAFWDQWVARALDFFLEK